MYLQLADAASLDLLAEKVRTSSFSDAKGTVDDPALLGPPSLELASYPRVTTFKKRNDARQGTIDQEPEFIEFLESLTSPIVKPAATDVTSSDAQSKGDAKKVTPLIQYLRDKKAAKEKGLSVKAGKGGRIPPKPENADPRVNAKGTTPTTKGPVDLKDKAKTKSGQQDVVSKEAAKSPPKVQVAPATVSPTEKANVFRNARPAPPRSQDPAGRVTAAARMIQRDLGLKSRPRASAQDNTKGPAIEQSPLPSQKPQQATTVPDASKTNSVASKSPGTTVDSNKESAAHAQDIAPAKPTNASPKAGVKATQAISPSTSTRAFLKHANPSQGITEPLLVEALTPFGAVVFVEIDKRKGFAYANFSNATGLQHAIKGSPVKVAQGSVTVLERRDRGGTVTPASVIAKSSGQTSKEASSQTQYHQPQSSLESQRAPTAPASMRGMPSGATRGHRTTGRGDTTVGGSLRGGLNTARGAAGPRGSRGAVRGRTNTARGGPTVSASPNRSVPTEATNNSGVASAVKPKSGT
ncbi:MAG: hypothetical protein M1828_004638 [Chrysothrix sp. TS-e1954]|nr:MAG: hypothetical protein M1828_004638 [Chrysothrix sp. TS-e1954]